MKNQMMIIFIVFLFIPISSTALEHAQNQNNIQNYQRTIPLEPRIIYVDDDNINGPWYGTIEYPFKLIRMGLGAAFDGDIVYVFEGTYEECYLDVYNQITIQGENPSNTIVDGKGYSIIYIRKPNVVLTGFTFRNAIEYSAIWMDSHHITINNNIITECTRGIFAPLISDNITISNNVIYNNQEEGIKMYSDNNYFTISNNTFIDNPSGIKISGGNHHIIIENNIFQNNKYGVLIGAGNRGYAQCFSITNNIFEESNNTGLCLDFTSNSLISQNTFKNNNQGLFFKKANGNQITKNNFIGNNEHVTFRYYEKRERCYFRQNYWDNWFKFLPIPKPIKGFVRFYNWWGGYYDRLWYNIDWFPAIKPYE